MRQHGLRRSCRPIHLHRYSRSSARISTPVITTESYSQALEKQSMEVMVVPPEASDQFLAKERKLWSDAVKLTGVTLD